jgi:hypothetical protein
LQEARVETTLYSLAETPPEAPAKVPERRTSERYLTLLRVGTLTIGERRELCLIKNISAGGLMVRTYSPIGVGTHVTLELKQGVPIKGVVRWVEDELVGVTFDTPIDVLGLLCSSMEGPRPRMPRIEVECTTWVREGADVRRTRALNISQGGVCVECPFALTIGAEVVVTPAALSAVPGVVRWKDGNSYGISFNRVLPLPELVGWLRAQQERQRAA